MKRNNFADEKGKWRKFIYKKHYQNDQAIAVFIYDTLIEYLKTEGTVLSITEESKQFVKSHQEDEIFEKMRRVN